ncbi:unnamed protein product [Aphanomyces euteiches]
MTNPANNANTPPDADPQADKPVGQEPPQAETDSTDDDDVKASSEAVSFDERRRRASDRKSSSLPTANVWQHFAKQRQAAAKAAKLDIGYHRPTMEQLAPVLLLAEDPSTTGRQLFEALEASLPSPPHPVVTYMQMDVGHLANQIDEGKAMRAVLHDHNNEGIDEGLTDIVQLTVDTTSHQLVWGLASLTAAAILENKAKAHLWDILRAAGATPISGIYTNTSESFGTIGSRYRLTLKSSDPPAMFKSNGRLIDEIIFLGKCYRVFGRDWFNHRKQTQRADLDILAREKKVPLPGSQASPNNPNPRTTQNGKRQRVDQDPESPRELVTKGATLGSSDTPLPWTSPNMYQALDDRVVVSTKIVANKTGSDIMVLPAILERPDAPLSVPQDAYVSGTKVHRNKAVRVKTSLNTTLDELAALDAAVAEAQAAFESNCLTAASKTKLNLAQYVEAGEADWIQQDLEDHPIIFRRQLNELALSSPQLLQPLVQLQLLNRWLRASQGASTPFPKLYTDTFGHRFSLTTLSTDFETLVASSKLEQSVCSMHEDTSQITPVEVETILAFTEMILGASAPLIYSSDTAIYSLTAQPVFSIPSRSQSRYLASATVRHILWGSSTLGTALWDALKAILTAAHTAAKPTSSPDDENPTQSLDDVRQIFNRWAVVMNTMEIAEELEALNVEFENQVMLETSTRRLVQGDLTDLWTDFTVSASG